MRSFIVRTALAAALVGPAALVALTGPAAQAIPDSGAGASTAGTSASASPRSLTAGSTIRFTVNGFPAGEVVYIKIDDGQFCSAKAVHGACMVHQQRLSGSGSAAGSFVLPGDLTPGRHWLRFLASKEMTDASGNYLGVKGYTTRRGSEFTIVSGGGTAGSGSAQSGDTSGGTTTGSAAGSTALAAGTTLVVTASPSASATASASASGSATDGSADGTADDTVDDSEQDEQSSSMTAAEKASIEAAVDAALAADAPTDQSPTQTEVTVTESGFPWVGSAGLLVMLAAAAVWFLRARTVRLARSRG